MRKLRTIPVKLALTAATLIPLVIGCDSAPEAEIAVTPATEIRVSDKTVQTKAGKQFWQQGQRQLIASSKASAELRDSAIAFLDDSSAEKLDQLRQSWHRAHNSYAAFNLYVNLGYISPALFGAIEQANFRIDAHPIQPGFLDAFDIYTHSGIVNDIAMPISAAAVRAQHGFSDDTDVSTGFHALAYLIFGESGERPIEQLQASRKLSAEQKSSGLKVSDLPNNRRRSLIKLLCELLLDDQQKLQSQWLSNSGELHTTYMTLQPGSQLQLAHKASQLAIDNTLATAQKHNQFAGAEHDYRTALINGLKVNIEQQLEAQIITADVAAAWLQQLDSQSQQQLQSFDPSSSTP